MLRWGVIGTGGIATRFVSDLELVPDASVAAVGSRARARADEFADRLGIEHRHASYLDLVDDEDVDVIYVATPHAQHFDAVNLALDGGKHVLCEKAFTINARQAEALVVKARDKGLFLMEAMWTRFLPHVVRIRELLAAGVLGDLVSVVADHGQWFAYDPLHRLFNPQLGGGALLDLGVYPISFASMALGSPSAVRATVTKTPTGVDASDVIALAYDGQLHASLYTTLQARTPTIAVIIGTAARIEIGPRFYGPSSFDLVRRDGTTEHFAFPHEGNGLRHEAIEVGRCLRHGLTESPVMPLDETVDIMRVMDEVRAQAGIVLPGDETP
jgi:predicted dehydrogenase